MGKLIRYLVKKILKFAMNLPHSPNLRTGYCKQNYSIAKKKLNKTVKVTLHRNTVKT